MVRVAWPYTIISNISNKLQHDSCHAVGGLGHKDISIMIDGHIVKPVRSVPITPCLKAIGQKLLVHFYLKVDESFIF